MKVKVVCRKVFDYVRYDLREIAFPSSLPDPPLLKKRHKLTWHDRFLVLKEASMLYASSWVRDIGPDLRPNDHKKDEGIEGKPSEDKNRTKEAEPSTLEDIDAVYGNDLIAVAGRGGMETLRPALQRLYMTRASAYRDAQEFYREISRRYPAGHKEKGRFESPTRREYPENFNLTTDECIKAGHFGDGAVVASGLTLLTDHGHSGARQSFVLKMLKRVEDEVDLAAKGKRPDKMES